MKLRRIAVLVPLALVAVFTATPAQATMPGANGRIAFNRGGDIYTVAADGKTGLKRLTTYGGGGRHSQVVT